jgi:hypothetical protein
MRSAFKNALAAAALVLALLAAPAHAASEGQRVTVTGEIMDTWCYFSGVMGWYEATLGSAHHTCAMWCAAGGIPVGLVADDGTVYMVLKMPDEDSVIATDTMLEIQSDRITADGMLRQRDGINYIVVHEVVANEGIVNRSHEDFGIVPPFAIPKPK